MLKALFDIEVVRPNQICIIILQEKLQYISQLKSDALNKFSFELESCVNITYKQ